MCKALRQAMESDGRDGEAAGVVEYLVDQKELSKNLWQNGETFAAIS